MSRFDARGGGWVHPFWLAAVLVATQPLAAATIEVDDVCTLVDAIDAANNDDDSGGLCPPGGSGPDTLALTDDIELTAIHNTTMGANGLPLVLSDITIDGRGHEISRPSGAPEFRFFRVEPGAALSLADVTVRGGVGTDGGNYGPAGGAIYADFSVVALSRTTLRDNSAEIGGAIYGKFADLVITQSTVSGNYARDMGGGIGTYVSSITGLNSTFSGNSTAYVGGAIWGGYGSGLTLVNSTVASNSAAIGGGVSDYGSFSIPIDVYDSVIGYNAGGDCLTYFVDDGGGNFDSDGSCGVSGALSGLDPALADNGGPTATHALLDGSSTIDAAGDCGLAEDQRGLARDAACDSGSFEFGAAPVGGSAFGARVQRVVCRNVTAGRTAVIVRPEAAWDCEGAGLDVDSGDRVRQEVFVRPDVADTGGTAIGVGLSSVRCENRTTGQTVEFQPASTLTWSCRERGLVFERGDRLVQVILGVAD